MVSWLCFIKDAAYKQSLCSNVFFLQPTQRASLYYFRKIYTMWFLPHVFCHHDLFTLQKFCACIDKTFLVPNKSTWQSSEKPDGLMAWTSSLQEERFIWRLINRFISLIFYQLQLLWRYWVFTCYSMILEILCMSLFGRFQFWVPTHFLNLI